MGGSLTIKVEKRVVAMALCFSILPGFKTEAMARNGAAFLGGMVAGHLITDAVQCSERRTEAAEYQAYRQPRTVQQLAAGGYITPEEYKTKKKAILNDM